MEIGILSVVLQGGSFALIVWAAVHWLPQVSKGYGETVKAMAQSFAEALRAEREDTSVRVTLADQQTERRHRENLELVRQVIDQIAKVAQQLLSENVQTRHAIKNLSTRVSLFHEWLKGREGDPDGGKEEPPSGTGLQ